MKILDIAGLRDEAQPRAKAFFPSGKAPVGVVLLAIALAAIAFSLPKSPQQESNGSIDVFIEGPPSVLEGAAVRIGAFSSCGDFSVFADGNNQGGYSQSARLSLILPPGSHRIEAKNGNCSAGAEFIVLERQCEDGQAEGCEVGKCAGNRTCFGGRWGGCIFPERVCPPGQRIGCSTDGCHFGYTTCNGCGTGFGPCLPENGTKESAGCAGNACG